MHIQSLGGTSSKEYGEKNANLPKERETAKADVSEKRLAHSAKHGLTSTPPHAGSHTRRCLAPGSPDHCFPTQCWPRRKLKSSVSAAELFLVNLHKTLKNLGERLFASTDERSG